MLKKKSLSLRKNGTTFVEQFVETPHPITDTFLFYQRKQKPVLSLKIVVFILAV